jgi:Glycosyl transferase family 11
MVLVKLSGGLGNQMFQYAMGRHLSVLNNSELLLDTRSLEYELKVVSKRDYELSNFPNLQAKIADKNQLPFDILPIKLRKYLILKYNLFSKIGKYKYIFEKNYLFDSHFLELRGNLFLIGYWVMEPYFLEIRDRLLQDFATPPAFFKLFEELINDINTTDSVCLHIRRGDYLNVGWALDMKYYDNAINAIAQKITTPKFYIFSDDIDWVKQNFDYVKKYSHQFIELTDNERNINEFRLMQLCKHFIMANSTFSWWASWLNTNPNKMILYPDRWNLMDYLTDNEVHSSYYKIAY